MKLLIDIGHPAHVHLFRNLAGELEKQGHQVLITCRDKECTVALLKSYGFSFINFGKPYQTRPGKLAGLLVFNYKMLRVLLRFRPDLTIGHSSIYAAQMSRLLGIPHISMEDTGNMEQIRLYKPFTKAILVPTSFNRDLGKKQLKYPGNHELAYLHPKRFTPDSSQLSVLKLRIGEPFVILRFVAWKATHDAGHHGMSMENKRKVIREFSNHVRVFISSELPLPEELRQYELTSSPEKIHHIVAYSSLVFGESATMASEAAVLGIPAIYMDNTGRCYTKEEEEKFGLVFNFSESPEDQERAIQKAVDLLTHPGAREEWQQKRQRLLNDKIDVTGFLAWYVVNFPESDKQVRVNPDYLDNFKG